MLEVNPNKEILKIHTSFMGVTAWQGIWMVAGVIAGSVVYFILPFPSAVKAPMIIPIVVFFAAVGLVNIHGMNLGQVLAAMIQTARLKKHPLILENERGEYNVNDYEK